MSNVITQACSQVDNINYHNGLLAKGLGKGNYRVVDAQELAAV
ncbi:hypothetical protein [Grimontia marina]|uniref:Uncharacterized protein n=1 Tax=Grimontia marina TaxID=646534 RepID=A0A128FA38_9GAMM|nr:hypothetical protein [Grimontia marina]CZF83667.1 hypothetical protein GMA8713_02758 [Grimontia marina]